MLKIHQKPFIQEITEPWMLDRGLHLFIKREDVIHPYVSGNKWRKLKYNLEEAKIKGHDRLLTFGGAYSNHIYATAAAAKEEGLKSIGVIRGEELEKKPLNHTLSFASGQGMDLHFVSREEYRKKDSSTFKNILRDRFGDFYLIPEGGTNELAIAGTKEILDESTAEFDTICSSVGTGGTLTGIILGSLAQQQILGFSALKGDFLQKAVADLLNDQSLSTRWSINSDFHFGGYAKVTPELSSFMQAFESKHKILLDPIYTGKMMYGVYELMKNNKFISGQKILAIHTGGLQGRIN